MNTELSGAQPSVDNVDDGIVAEQTAGFKPEAEEPKVETTDQPQPEGEQPQDTSNAPKKKGGWQKKIEKLTYQVNDLESRYQQSQQELERYRSGAPEQKSVSSEEPKAEDFETFDQYVRAQAKWEAQQTVRQWQDEQSQKSQQEKLQQEFQSRQMTYEQKAQEYAKADPGFVNRVNDLAETGFITQPVYTAIVESELGPQVADYLAKNLDQAQAISRMGMLDAYRAIGKIEAKLETSPAKIAETKAPPPITPSKAPATTASIDPKDMTQEQYERWRYGGN